MMRGPRGGGCGFQALSERESKEEENLTTKGERWLPAEKVRKKSTWDRPRHRQLWRDSFGFTQEGWGMLITAKVSEISRSGSETWEVTGDFRMTSFRGVMKTKSRLPSKGLKTVGDLPKGWSDQPTAMLKNKCVILWPGDTYLEPKNQNTSVPVNPFLTTSGDFISSAILCNTPENRVHIHSIAHVLHNVAYLYLYIWLPNWQWNQKRKW